MEFSLKVLALWFAILALAVVNGALREKILVPTLGKTIGLLVSGVLLLSCIWSVAWVGSPWFGPLTTRQALSIGAAWLVLTLTFEFAFGRLAQHKTWPELLAAYTFRGGNLWPLVLLATVLAPWGAAKTRGILLAGRVEEFAASSEARAAAAASSASAAQDRPPARDVQQALQRDGHIGERGGGQQPSRSRQVFAA